MFLQDLQELGIDFDGSVEDAHGGPGELDVSLGKKDAIVIEVRGRFNITHCTSLPSPIVLHHTV